MPNKPQVEVRAFPQKLEFREAKKDGIIGTLSGYAVIFGAESRDFGGWREVITRGAFTESIQKTDIRMLYQHQPHMVMARQAAGNLRISEDERGLLFEADLVDTMVNRDAWTNIRAGNIDAMSFGMPTASIVRSWSQKDGYDLCTITRADIIEVSPVTWAAYEATEVAARNHEDFRAQVRDQHKSPLELIRSRVGLEKLRYN